LKDVFNGNTLKRVGGRVPGEVREKGAKQEKKRRTPAGDKKFRKHGNGRRVRVKRGDRAGIEVAYLEDG